MKERHFIKLTSLHGAGPAYINASTIEAVHEEKHSLSVDEDDDVPVPWTAVATTTDRVLVRESAAEVMNKMACALDELIVVDGKVVEPSVS